MNSFAAEDRESEKIRRSLTRFLHSQISRSILETFAAELMLLIGALGGFVALWYSELQITEDDFTIGGYIAFSGYLMKLYVPVQMFANTGLLIQPVVAALRRVNDLLDLVTEEEDPNRTVHVSELKGKVVSFSYDGGSEVLHRANLQVEPGEKVAIVGRTGSGKSTILRLLLGFYKVDSGIAIDGMERNRLVLADLREHIGVVSQNLFLFNDTIRNNILYSAPWASEEQVIEASKLADAHDSSPNCPRAMTPSSASEGICCLEVNGRSLLSPERYSNLIFDEATSHLDNVSEARVKNMIRTVFEHQTCLIVVHRLSTISHVDRVYVLDEGRIVESGTHDQLLGMNGAYSRLYAGARS